jgi:hypothetical protein
LESILSTVLLYLALGAFAGVMAGLLGVGGGLIIVPVLAWIFHGQPINDAMVMHLAIGTSLATIVVTSTFFGPRPPSTGSGVMADCLATDAWYCHRRLGRSGYR